jgi:hypothetical protein
MRALRRLHPPVSFVAQPTNHSLLGLEAQRNCRGDFEV